MLTEKREDSFVWFIILFLTSVIQLSILALILFTAYLELNTAYCGLKTHLPGTNCIYFALLALHLHRFTAPLSTRGEESPDNAEHHTG